MTEEKLKNPFKSHIKLWRVEFDTKYKNIFLLELMFEDPAIGTSCFSITSPDIEAAPEDLWRFICYFSYRPDEQLFTLQIQAMLEGRITVYEEKTKIGFLSFNQNQKLWKLECFTWQIQRS